MTDFKLQDESNAVPGDPLYDEISRINNELINIRRQLAKKNLELERLNEEKNHFLGMAAHDLRSPLNAILSFSDFLIDEASSKLDQEHIEFLDIIRSSSNFMLGLVNDLLDVAKIESGKLQLDLQPTDLVGLMNHNIALNSILAAKKQIALEFEHQAQIPIMLVDGPKIEQVLNNLISNAVKYSYPGSEVKVSVTLIDANVLISVQDNGQGIPNSEFEKLFKPFSGTSVKSTTGEKSTGLGLVIARKIIDGHQGKIWLESKVGQGTTFYVSLPIRELKESDQ